MNYTLSDFRGRFHAMPNIMLDYLPSNEYMILAQIHAASRKSLYKGDIKISQRTLTRLTGLCRKSVVKATRALEQLNLLSCATLGGKSAAYSINWDEIYQLDQFTMMLSAKGVMRIREICVADNNYTPFSQLADETKAEILKECPSKNNDENIEHSQDECSDPTSHITETISSRLKSGEPISRVLSEVAERIAEESPSYQQAATILQSIAQSVPEVRTTGDQLEPAVRSSENYGSHPAVSCNQASHYITQLADGSYQLSVVLSNAESLLLQLVGKQSLHVELIEPQSANHCEPLRTTANYMNHPATTENHREPVVRSSENYSSQSDASANHRGPVGTTTANNITQSEQSENYSSQLAPKTASYMNHPEETANYMTQLETDGIHRGPVVRTSEPVENAFSGDNTANTPNSTANYMTQLAESGIPGEPVDEESGIPGSPLAKKVAPWGDHSIIYNNKNNNKNKAAGEFFWEEFRNLDLPKLSEHDFQTILQNEDFCNSDSDKIIRAVWNIVAPEDDPELKGLETEDNIYPVEDFNQMLYSVWADLKETEEDFQLTEEQAKNIFGFKVVDMGGYPGYVIDQSEIRNIETLPARQKSVQVSNSDGSSKMQQRIERMLFVEALEEVAVNMNDLTDAEYAVWLMTDYVAERKAKGQPYPDTVTQMQFSQLLDSITSESGLPADMIEKLFADLRKKKNRTNITLRASDILPSRIISCNEEMDQDSMVEKLWKEKLDNYDFDSAGPEED